MNHTRSLNHRIAVVTGSTRGIGFAIAAALAHAGAKVVISSRTQAAVDAACQRLTGVADEQILGVACDVCDLTQVTSLAARTLDHFGALDIWINNAGISSPYAATDQIAPEQWQAVIQTNVLGTYHGTTTALAHMLPKNQGKIINLFGAGDQDSPVDKYEYMSAYAASKAAVRRFTLVTAAEYRHTRLSILGLRPGLVATDLMTKIEPLNDEAAQRLQGLDLALNLFTTPIEQVQATVVKMASAATDGQSGKIYQCQVRLPTIAQRLWQSRKGS